MEKLRYPIGKFRRPANFTGEVLRDYITVIQGFPAKLRAETEHLSDDQLDTPYRPEGWTIRQVIHHCADSHLNAFIRFKLALTEETPAIKPYNETAWAELPDSKTMQVQPSLFIMEGIHQRWARLLRNFGYNEWKKTFYHPEEKTQIALDESTGRYAWHCSHHLAHITSLKKKMRWR
jgi:hypothetical protein